MKVTLKQPYRQFFGTLANQVRLEIINLLIHEKSNVNGIVKYLSYDQSTVSHSLRRLTECGFVSFEKKGKERFYSINKKTILPLMELMQDHMKTYCKHVVAKRMRK